MNAAALRSRIVGHRKVRAADLKPHPLNPRRHDEVQRAALRSLLEEIGFARSVLAYVADADKGLPDPPLTLIDGHLRRDELAGAEIEAEVLDVTDAEAQALLLSIDPLAQLATYNEEILADLRSVVEQESAAVAGLWAALDAGAALVRETLGEAEADKTKKNDPPMAEAFYVLIECRDEAEQVRLLARFQAEGLTCSAKIA